MADRSVTHSEKDAQGDILGLCWQGIDGLKHVDRVTAIQQIVAGTHRYVVAIATPPVLVLARPADNPTYLTTEADGISKNNLDNLPNCNRPT
jgi:hypothetical protein